MVEDCGSLPELLTALDHPVDAVVITELSGDPDEAVIDFARERCPAPIILFQSADCHCPLWEFDLVIPNLTPPRSWLDRIGATIERSQALRAESRTLAEKSARLRLESAAARHRSARERRATHPSLKPPTTPGNT